MRGGGEGSEPLGSLAGRRVTDDVMPSDALCPSPRHPPPDSNRYQICLYATFEKLLSSPEAVTAVIAKYHVAGDRFSTM